MALLGKADPTLAQGAYSVAVSKAPGDMSQIYKQREKNIKNLTEGIQAAWDSQFEAYNAYEARMTEKSDLAIMNTLEGKTNDSMLAAVDSEVRRIKSEMQTFDKRDKGSLEWKKLESQLGRLVSTTQADHKRWGQLTDAIANGDMHILGAGDELQLFEAMVDDYNNNTNLTNGRIVDGDFVYSLPSDPSVTMTMSELEKRFTVKDATAPTGIMEIINNVEETAGQSKRRWDKEYIVDTRNAIRNHLKSSSDRKNVIFERFPGMEYSFWEALTNGKDANLQGQIYDALEGLNTDIDNDGNVDNAETYANPANAVALQKEILNNAGSRDLIADFLTNNIGESAYGRGRVNYTRSGGGGGSGTPTEEQDYSTLNQAIATKDFGILNSLYQGERTITKTSKGYYLQGLKGSKEISSLLVKFDDPTGDQQIMNWFTGGGVEYSRPMVDVNKDGIDDSEQYIFSHAGQTASPPQNTTGFDVKSLIPTFNKPTINW